MKRLLRFLLVLSLRRPKGLWVLLGVMTLLLGWGALRVERRLDLMSLLPTEHPVVRASIEAGVGQQELLWLAAEGDESNLEARQAWAEGLVERLLTDPGMPLNGLSGEARISSPQPVPGPKGASLWPPLLAAGSFMEGDAATGRLVTEQFYALAPMLLGDRLQVFADPAEVRARLARTAKALGSPDPIQARLAQLDPLGLRELLPQGDDTQGRVTQSAKGFPLRLRTGYLESKDARLVLVPLVLNFSSSEAPATAKVLTWLGQGAVGPFPKKASLAQAEKALAPQPERQIEGQRSVSARSFPLQVTGAHAIALWESQRLTEEVLISLGLSFLLIGLVYWMGFRSLAGYGFVVIPLLLGMFWTFGLVGWILGRLNLMAAAFGAVLLGIGDDVGILIFSRYREERVGGRSKALALRAALMGTGPGVIAGTGATALAFLACVVAPFPGFRDLGLTAGIGLLACLASNFLLLPVLLLSRDKGKGAFAPASGVFVPARSAPLWKPAFALLLILGAAWGARKLTWEEDLRRFRQQGNPALALQERLGKLLGAGLQPLALQIPLDDPERLPQRWNRLAPLLRREGLPMPDWAPMAPDLRRVLGSDTWVRQALEQAGRAGLDPTVLERPFLALRTSVEDPLAVPQSLQALLAPPQAVPEGRSWTLADWFKRRSKAGPTSTEQARFTLPLRLPEAAQDRLEPELQAQGIRLVGTRPLFRAIKTVAKDALREVVLVALGAVLLVVALFGRRPRFVALALVPLLASQIGVVGILGWSGEPLTFLSLVAIPIALGVSVDTAMNLLHRARLEPQAAARVARVNAVCAGTTLAGFGGLVFSGYRGLRGLGLACLGGVLLAMLVTQWLLPWIVEKWPLRPEGKP